MLLFVLLTLTGCNADMPDRPQGLQARYLYVDDSKAWQCELFEIPDDPNKDWIDKGACNPGDINKSFDFTGSDMVKIKQYIKDLNSYIGSHCQ